MTFRAVTPRLLILAAALLAPGFAVAQTSVKLDGRCEKLVIAGKDLSASCRGTMMNLVSRNRTSFDFATSEGRTLSFSGNGLQQERTEDSDPLQPINLVIPGESGKAGVMQNPVLVVGACRFSTPKPGLTMIACEAESTAQGSFAGTFVTDAKAPAEAGPPAAPKP